MNGYLAIALIAALLALAVVLWGLKQRIDAANKKRTITVNGKKYRVRFERIRKSAEEANERACRRCAFFDYYNCGGANCCHFIRTNRRDVETHYAYFKRLPDPGKRDNLAAALGAVVIVALLAFLLTGCSGKPIQTVKDVKGSTVIVRKVEVEGHEYLIFRGMVDMTFNRSFAAVHSESCPCKTKEGEL